jgi:hypothetical protein
MANIDVVEKKSGLSWMWIILIVALIAVALWWAFGGQRSSPASGQIETPAGPAMASLENV